MVASSKNMMSINALEHLAFSLSLLGNGLQFDCLQTVHSYLVINVIPSGIFGHTNGWSLAGLEIISRSPVDKRLVSHRYKNKFLPATVGVPLRWDKNKNLEL